MTRFTPRVEHLDGDVFDTIQAFCRLVVPKASPHDGRNAMRGEKTGCPNIQFRAQGGRRMSIFSRISSRISYSDFTSCSDGQPYSVIFHNQSQQIKSSTSGSLFFTKWRSAKSILHRRTFDANNVKVRIRDGRCLDASFARVPTHCTRVISDALRAVTPLPVSGELVSV